MLFLYQHAIDNESACGDIGTEEGHCAFAILDNLHEHSDHPADQEHKHICVNCPCNSILIWTLNLDLYKIYTELFISYNTAIFPESNGFEYISYLNRPPKQTSL